MARWGNGKQGDKKSGKDGWIRTDRVDSWGRPIYIKNITAAREFDYRMSVDPMSDFAHPPTQKMTEPELSDGELREYIPQDVFQAIGMESPLALSPNESMPLYAGEDGETIVGYAVSTEDGYINILSSEKPYDVVSEITYGDWGRVTAMNAVDMFTQISGEHFENEDAISEAYMEKDGTIHLSLAGKGIEEGEEIVMVPRRTNVGYYDYYHISKDGEATRIDDGHGEHIGNTGMIVDHVVGVKNNTKRNMAILLNGLAYAGPLIDKMKSRRKKNSKNMQSISTGGFLSRLFKKALTPFDSSSW